MLRAALITDPHETEGQRFADAKACNDWAVDDAIEAKCDLFGWLGDFNGTTDLCHKPTTLEQNTWDVRFQRCADHAPVVILYGNHDGAGTLDGYARLAAVHPIIVVSLPEVIDLYRDGEGRWHRGIGPDDAVGARIFALPYPWKGDWLNRVHDASIDEKHAAIEGGLRDLLLSWHPLVREARERSITTFFFGHVAIKDCALAGGETLPVGGELTIAASDLEALDCDFSATGHIHLCQQVGPKAYIVGSDGRSNFGETDPKGYLLVDAAAGRLPAVHRRLTPARPFVTVQARWSLDTGAGVPGWEWERPDAAQIAGAEVRVQVSIPEAALGICPTGDLADLLRADGAVDVVLRPTTIPKQALRCPEIVDAEDLEAQLHAFWNQLGDESPDAAQRTRCLALAAELQREDTTAEAA